MWSGNVKSAFASLRMSKWRTILTTIGIVIGVSSVITVVSLGEGLKSQVVGQINQLGSDLITVRSGELVSRDQSGIAKDVNLLAFFSPSTLTNDDIEALNEESSLDAVVPMAFVTNSAKSNLAQMNNAFVIGTSPDLSKVLNQSVRYGVFFQQDGADKNFVVIGSNVAENLFGRINPVGNSLQVMGESFIVQGVLEQSSGGLFSIAQTDFNSSIFMPYTRSMDLTDGRVNLLQILVKGDDAENLDETVDTVRKTLLGTHNSQENFTVLKQFELLNIASGVVNILTGFISGIAAISLFVAGVGIMNILLASVSERTREIGIRKAVGATNRQILNQFLAEGLVLSVGGGLIGILVSLAIYGGLKVYTDTNPVLTVPIMVLAVGVSVAIGIVFSVAPALKASRKDPIDALRNQ